MTEAELQAIWERAEADRRSHDSWVSVELAILSPSSPLVRTPITHPVDEYLRLFGIKVQIDASLPPGELRLRSAGGEVRIINLG